MTHTLNSSTQVCQIKATHSNSHYIYKCMSSSIYFIASFVFTKTSLFKSSFTVASELSPLLLKACEKNSNVALIGIMLILAKTLRMRYFSFYHLERGNVTTFLLPRKGKGTTPNSQSIIRRHT